MSKLRRSSGISLLLSLSALGAATLSCILLDINVRAQSRPLSDYRPDHRVSGTIHISGSPQMADLLKLYESSFAVAQPKVRFESRLESTLKAVPSVSSADAEIGLLGRELWPTEAEAFAAVKGHPPLAIKVAIGSYDVPKATFALMVFVPQTNPIAALSLPQLERIFAASAHPIRTWGELGLNGKWASRPIHIYGFAKDNDKAQIFRRLVFKPSERWNPSLNEFSNVPGENQSDAGELILRAVARDPGGIGISNVHYATPAVRALPLAPASNARPVPPLRETVGSGAYPLTRAIYMVIDPSELIRSNTQSAESVAILEFLHYVLSESGRHAVIEEGNYLPLTPTMAQRELEALRAHIQ